MKLKCVICNVGYKLDDVGTNFFIRTGVCRFCYDEATRLPANQWCFGKADQYDPDTEECRELCPDRQICKMYVDLNYVKS